MSEAARYAARLERVRARLADAGGDALLVTGPANVRWLSGFTHPADARLWIAPDDALLLTDGRYTAQAAEESRLEPVIERDWRGWLAEHRGDLVPTVESEHTTVADLEDLERKIGGAVRRARDLIAPLRLVKDETEVAALRRAAALTDEALEHALPLLEPGTREIDVALELERFVRRRGAEVGFEIIVASGPRSSMPHGTASPREIGEGELVTIDFGARVDGYTADLTRTYAVGSVAPGHREIYDAVLEAQRAALAALGPGRRGRDIDAAAREVLAGRGLAELFSHSLGHGVGLEIHEGPRLAASSDDVLEPGMVVTVEPGAYRPGEAGVRIEDLVLVTADGCEVLSGSDASFRSLPL